MAVRIKLETTGWQRYGRDIQRLAASIPGKKAEVIYEIRDVIWDSVQSQYYGVAASGERRTLPVAHTGTWFVHLRAWIQPQLGAIVVKNTASYAAALEFGRSAGYVPRGVLYQWVLDKLDVTPQDAGRVAGAIRKKIMESGYEATHTLQRATDPYSDGTGPSLHERLGVVMDRMLNELINTPRGTT